MPRPVEHGFQLGRNDGVRHDAAHAVEHDAHRTGHAHLAQAQAFAAHQ